MKILYTATVLSHICQFHLPYLQSLQQQGHTVHVAAHDNLAEKNGLKLQYTDCFFEIPFHRSPKSTDNIRAYQKLKALLEQEKYDLILCNTPMGGIVTRLAARKSRKRGTKVIYMAHGFHFYKGAPKKNWMVFYPIEKCFARLTDKIITINREDFSLAKEKMHTNVYYIHGVGVDEQRYFPAEPDVKLSVRQELGFSKDAKIILCIGELLPNKNQTMAIRMMQSVTKLYPDALLLLAGNGPERVNLEHMITDCNLQNNVKLLGYCTCLEKYQQAADLLVSCSKREGLPLNIVEAMLSANPVVATKNRGHCELIEDGTTGYLVDVGDVNAMAERVMFLLKNPEKIRDMGMQGHVFAKSFGLSTVKKELEQICFRNCEG